MGLFGPDVYRILGQDYLLVFHLTFRDDVGASPIVYDCERSEFTSVLPGWSRFRTYAELFSWLKSSCVYTDDGPAFELGTDPATIRSRLEVGAAHIVDTRFDLDGTLRWYAFKFSAIREKGMLTGCAVGVYDIDELMRDEMRVAEERSHRTAQFFSENYDTVFRCNLDDETYSIVKAPDEIRRAYGHERFYVDAFREYCEAEVAAEDRARMLAEIDRRNIRERLRQESFFDVRFREISSGSPRWWVLRINRIEGFPDDVIVAFSDRDKDIRHDIDREAKIEESQENFESLARALHALRSVKIDEKPWQFLEIVRARFEASGCEFVQYDFRRKLAVIGGGCSVGRDGKPHEKESTTDIQSCEGRLLELAERGLSIAVRRASAPVVVRGRMRGSLDVVFDENHLLSELESDNLRRLAEIFGSAYERREAYVSLELASARAERESAFVSEVLDLIPTPCFIKDAGDDFRYVRCNAAFAKFLGMSKEDILGSTDWDLFPPTIIARVRAHDTEAMEADRAISYIEEKPVGPGREPTPLLHWKRLMNENGGRRYILCGINTTLNSDEPGLS